MLKLRSQKTVLVLMHIRSNHILVLRKPSGDGHMQKSTAFHLFQQMYTNTHILHNSG